MPITHNPRQNPADAAVVLPTILRPSLLKAVRSVYTQNFPGHIHLLIGIDVKSGGDAVLNAIRAECPDHVSLTILDPGYSTSSRHGGVHANAYGGSLRTALSYLANSRYIAYLDDNDWWGANHLTLLRNAIDGKDWAWSGRWFVHPQTLWPICKDEWDSVGPGKGINAERFGGFVQPSGLMMDGTACHFLMPLWAMAAFADGGGEDRLIFDQLNKNHSGAGTGHFTSFCTLAPDSLQHDHHKREFLARGLTWIYDSESILHVVKLVDQVHETVAQSDWAGALRCVEGMLSIHPHLADALYLLAKIKQATGHTDDAVDAFALSIEVDDSHVARLTELADLLRQSGRAEDAARIMETIARRFGPHI